MEIKIGVGWKPDPDGLGWVSCTPADYVAEIELLRSLLTEAIAYADAAAREDGMPEGKQCKRLTIQEVVLLGKPASQNRTVEWDVAAARAAVS